MNSKLIGQEAFDALSQQHGPRIMQLQRELNGVLTHFEVLTALALQHFRDCQASIAMICRWCSCCWSCKKHISSLHASLTPSTR